MPNKKTKKQLIKEGKSKKEINAYFGINKKTGRPTKWTESKALELANELIEWLKEKEEWSDRCPKNVFYEHFLIVKKDLKPQIIYDLSRKYEKFAYKMKLAKTYQEFNLLELGLFQWRVIEYDENGKEKKKRTIKNCPRAVIWMLKTNHGYMEEEKKIKLALNKQMKKHRLEMDQLMNKHKIEMDTQTNQIRLQELEIKKEIAELNKKRNEDDLIHTITFDDSNPIINP